MQVAILSDLHDNYTAWQIILKQIQQQKIETILYCGDLAAPSMLKKMIEEYEGQVHLVFGNVADRETETKIAGTSDKVTHYGDQAELEIDGKKIALNHFPDKGKELAESGQYDYVFHGHNHQQAQAEIGNTTLINPGTAGGMFQYPSYAVVDFSNDTVEFKNITL
ncbi:MAG: YfcE family phosphodiesterase [Patescibacteria group bacterium]